MTLYIKNLPRVHAHATAGNRTCFSLKQQAGKIKSGAYIHNLGICVAAATPCQDANLPSNMKINNCLMRAAVMVMQQRGCVNTYRTADSCTHCIHNSSNVHNRQEHVFTSPGNLQNMPSCRITPIPCCKSVTIAHLW
jgi:hypothetical protein